MQLDDIFNHCLELSKLKAADYAAEGNKHENFQRTAELASWFNNNIDLPYVILIGTKLARLSTLLNHTREPKNESIEDTFLDLVNYCALWAEMRTTLVPTFEENHIAAKKLFQK